MNNNKVSYRTKKLWLLMILLISCCLWVAGFSVAEVHAGAESDGNVPDPVTYDPDIDTGGLTYTEVIMKPGQTYDISKNTGATWMSAYESGTYRLVGESTKTLLMIFAQRGEDITVIFGDENQGIRLVATKDCPGSSASARSAITIDGAVDAKVTLKSAAGQTCYFRGKGGVPAIRKDTTNVETVFETEDVANPGTIEVHADPDATKTSGIGCYSTFFTRNTFGNVKFRSGKVCAYGSQSGFLGGGPGIGADNYGQVDGVTFEGADVEAYAGSGSSAAIGTASSYVFMPFAPNPDSAGDENNQEQPVVGDEPEEPIPADRLMGVVCRNITISSGSVKAFHDINVNKEEQNGGAGIGGGWGCHSDSIIIEGGEVYAKGTPGAAGIGSGLEGNCNGYDDSGYRPRGYDGAGHGIIIRGGNVRAEGGASGIGSGFAEDSVNDVDRFRFGDCRVEISGGEVTAKADQSGGMGIGGYKGEEYNPVMKVIISGGRVTATGKGCAIGAGIMGAIREINISGGIVQATSTGDGNPAIGSLKSNNSQSARSLCKAVNITGGTVKVLNSTQDGPGLIGGYKSEKGTTPVYISGGNVYGAIYKSDAFRPGKDGPAVFSNKIAIQGYGLNTDLRSREDIHIDELVFEGGSPDYGLNEAYLFPSVTGEDPVMYIWLPKDVSVRSAKTDPAFLKYGLKLRKQDISDFQGVTKESEGGKLYPALWFLFDDNYKICDTDKCCALAAIGDTAVKEETFKPEAIKSEDGLEINPAYYTVDKQHQTVLLKKDGTFEKDVKDESTTWTDGEGRLLMTSADPGKHDTRDVQNCYVSGTMLYGVWEDYILSFDGNKPDDIAAEMSGSMSSEIHKYSDKMVAPDSGFVLPTFAFKGWSTVKDPSEDDPIYETGTPVDPSELDPDKTGKIMLYAQWEPAEYQISYDLDGGRLPEGQSNPEKYTAYDEDITLVNPEKEGFDFKGWTGTEQDTPEMNITIKKGSTGDRSYKANWAKKHYEESTFEISFDLDGGTLDGKTGTVIMTCRLNEIITIPDAPQKKGYKFQYWKGSKYYPGDKYKVTGDHNFTAVWKEAGGSGTDTGDHSLPGACIAIALIAVLIGAAAVIRRKKE